MYDDDMKLFLKGVSIDLPERTRILYDLLKKGQRFIWSFRSLRVKKKAKIKLEISNPYFRQRRQVFRREEWFGMEGRIGYLGIDKRTCLKKPGKFKHERDLEKKSGYCQETQGVSKAVSSHWYGNALKYGTGACQNLGP